MKWFIAVLWILTLGVAVGVGHQVAVRNTSQPVQTARTTPNSVEDRLSDALRDRDMLTRTYHWSQSLQELDEDNIDAAVAVLEAQRLGVSEGEVRLFMLAWCRFDPEGAFAWASAWPGSWRPLLERSVIFAWAFRNAGDAAAMVASLETDRRRRLRPNLVSGWARTDDTKGLTDFILSLPQGPERPTFIAVLLSELAMRGPAAVRNWAEAVPVDAPDQAKVTAFMLASGNLTQNDPSRATELFEAHQQFEYAQPALKTIARRWAEYHEPSELFAWLVTLPASDARSNAVEIGFNQWWTQNAPQARAWLRDAALDEALDPAVAIFAREVSRSSAVRAIKWADRIHDESLRRRTLTPILRAWAREDRAAARAWMKEHGVPREVQREILNAAGE